MAQPKIKLCGMTIREDVMSAIELGVDYIGYVVNVPTSPRSISLEQLRALCSAGAWYPSSPKLRRTSAMPLRVAVTVNASREELKKMCEVVDILQLHGEESVEFCASLTPLKKEIWRAFVTEEDPAKMLQTVEPFRGKVDRFVMDIEKGRNASFGMLETYRRLKDAGYALMLSGGLSPENIAFYVRELEPEIVDVVRGIESETGRKDLEKMKQFIQNCRLV